MLRLLRSGRSWVAVLALVLALGFLGTRDIWDPDEGRYTNVALNMLDSGDWLDPHRNHEVDHWTKPPLTYWAVASSVAVFGRNPWAARLPAALAYLLTVWLTWRIAQRLAPGSEAQAAVIYATMLLPFGASQVITTDFILTASETLAVWAFIEARFGGSRRWQPWLALMWAGFALAFMTKGPPGLLPLLVLFAFNALMPRQARFRTVHWWGLLVFVLLAFPWYVAVILDNPGLFGHLVGDEVVSRVATDEFGRHGQWYGWLEVYLPTLLVGTLPWTVSLARWLRALPASLLRWWRDRAGREANAADLLLALWVLLPLLVFCLARSRLPLYLLPLFAPLAVAMAAQRLHAGQALPRWPWLLGWTVALLALKFTTSLLPSSSNAAEWAGQIRARVDGPVAEVVFIEDMPHYGLHLHLGAQVEKISLLPGPRAAFDPVNDGDLAQELAERERDVIWICKQTRWPELRDRIAALHYRAIPLGAPYRGRILFHIEPLPGPAPPLPH
ncbi:glycosyltransferase family 39 protein [Pseudoxanthomonas gei]|uniref:Glycosyltransferase family 39 protein n=1 Tax=Pseudoxanthomonas gei TaxID=1383030 RepID=A0ABX0AB57_9GAMM|nr:glycosyltransferase family 39 protein [Pseudoxanthomonas gei]NDK37882.1 glycosyltransferase family 39 protein [Pseudoxanthomonas gei]